MPVDLALNETPPSMEMTLTENGPLLVSMPVDDTTAVVAALPRYGALEIMSEPGTSRILPRLPVGSAATLLGFLRDADLTAAKAIAEDLMSDHVTPSDLDIVTAFALGYYLLRHNDLRCRPWVSNLCDRWSDYLDPLILDTALRLREGASPQPARLRGLVMKASSTLPLLSEGGPLLAECLRWASLNGDALEGPDQAQSTPRALEQVGEHLAAACPTLLTCYTAHPGGFQPKRLPTYNVSFEQMTVLMPWRVVASGRDVSMLPWPPSAEFDVLYRLWPTVADRVHKWIVTGDPGTRHPANLEREALDLLAAASTVDGSGSAATAALSELQRAELLSGGAKREAQERALSLFALLRDEEGGMPESSRHDVDTLLGSDRGAVLRAAGGLWREAGDRAAPRLAAWAALLVAGPGLDVELLQNRIRTLIGLEAETADHTHLHEAVFVGRAALAALDRPFDAAGSALAATTAFGMVRWYAITGDAGTLDEAIDLLRAESIDNHVWSAVPAVLVEALTRRASVTGSLQDVDYALAVGHSALAHPDLFATLATGLSAAHLTAFELTGRFADLDDAVVLARRTGHDLSPNLRRWQGNLARALHTRYRATRQLQDLTDAIGLYRELVRDAPQGTRLEARAKLAAALLDHYKRAGGQWALREAAYIADYVVRHTPETHSAYLGRLATVAAAHQLLGERSDAVDLYLRAAEMSLLDDPQAPERVFPLIQPLLDSGTDAGLSAAYSWANLLEATPEATSARAQGLILRGDILRARGEPAADAYRSAARVLGAASETRVQAAVRWARAAHDEGRPQDAVCAWSTAVDAVLRLASVGVDVETRQHLLAEWASVPREAAAYAIASGDPTTALEFLESGRTVLWNQAIDLRGDYSALAVVAPDIAARLAELASALAHPGDRDRVIVLRLAQEWEDLVAQARTYPGFEDFLLRPKADQLVKALGDRTVVVLNAADTRCDALIVTGTGVRVVPLPVAPHEVARATETMRAPMYLALPMVLPWLWENVVRPVLDTLALPPGSPLWWCPTGSFTLLPVHAAGSGDDNVHRRVVSSYTSTVTALVRVIGRPGKSTGTATFVGVDHAPGSDLAVLSAIPQEASAFRDAVGQRLDELLGARATKDAVRTAMANVAVLHLACHAQPSPANPRDSGLELWDGRLTVSELADGLTKPPDLVYLSACHTAVAGTTLPDEAISIAAAFLAAGSRNVIGTLWTVEDSDAAMAASHFYKALRGSGDPARALHNAVTELRARFPEQPAVWATYVHLGAGEVFDNNA